MSVLAVMNAIIEQGHAPHSPVTLTKTIARGWERQITCGRCGRRLTVVVKDGETEVWGDELTAAYCPRLDQPSTAGGK